MTAALGPIISWSKRERLHKEMKTLPPQWGGVSFKNMHACFQFTCGFFFFSQGHYSTAQTRAGAVIWGQAVTFCSGHKSARLYKSGGSRVMRREGGEQTQGQGPDTRQSLAEKRPCQLARLPWGSRCSVAADKRKWDFRWPPLSWRPAWDVKTNDGKRQAARLV